MKQTNDKLPQNMLVVGMGITGLSAVDYLRSKGVEVRIMDSRDRPPMLDKFKQKFPEVETILGKFPNTGLYESTWLVSPGVSLRQPVIEQAVANGTELVGDIELFLHENYLPVVAVTGSNGKSTVVELLAHLCQSAGVKPLLVGNIGNAVLDALEKLPAANIVILELSSFQLELIKSLNAQSVSILNISPDHLDRYDSMGEYINAKKRIFSGAEHIVYNRTATEFSLARKTDIASTSFGLDEPQEGHYGVVEVDGRLSVCCGKNALFDVDDVPLTGEHNLLNVLAAFALLDPFTLDPGRMHSGVKTFTGLAHRMQKVCVHKGVVWINDSKATNVGAAQAALRGMPGSVVWIAGGEGKGADFSELKTAVARCVKKAIVFGKDAKRLKQSLIDIVSFVVVSDLDHAVRRAEQSATDGDTVLFSPACASLDMYENYRVRGNHFIKLVNDLFTKDPQQQNRGVAHEN